MAAAEGKRLVLPRRNWGLWLETWFSIDELFEPLEIITRTECKEMEKLMVVSAHYYHPFNQGVPNLDRLLPKESIRNEAEQAVHDMLRYNLSNATAFVSVHRRSMDVPNATEECLARSKQYESFCFGNKITDEERAAYCSVAYSDVMTDLQKRDAESGTNFSSLPVVLFTDHQSPDLDDTFPYIDDHDFQVQSWMITQSVVHYGNPLSSMDYVLYHWRKGKEVRPTSCYNGYDSIVRPQLAKLEETTRIQIA